MIQALLEALTAQLERIAPEFPTLLNPPASPEQIAAAEAMTGIQFPQALRQLYALHDAFADKLCLNQISVSTNSRNVQ